MLHAAIKDALQMRTVSFDAIKRIWMFTRSCPEPISPRHPL